MPSRNTARVDLEHSYYHVYARGSSKQPIFIASGDYDYFIGLFKRYLSKGPIVSSTGSVYPNYSGKLELLAYCLMSNHFHLLTYQEDRGALTALMRSLMVSYSRYFNLRYGRTGSLFETRYKAVRIDGDSYLDHISRYIHLNPRYWKRYLYSSLNYYERGDEPEWLHTTKVLNLLGTRSAYLAFVAEYEETKLKLEAAKQELADS